MCQINKDKQNFKESKITFMTSQFFQLGQESYNYYLKLCSYESKEKFAQIYYKLIYKLIVIISKRLQGLNGLKLGVQLTVGIVHRVEQDKHFNKILAQILVNTLIDIIIIIQSRRLQWILLSKIK
ncbi:unnamed protein product [Paramecium primaurelia]|nr:unnamed protein product [Paramecium primaurelia]